MLPKALKSCPKSIKSPNLVTLVKTNILRRNIDPNNPKDSSKPVKIARFGHTASDPLSGYPTSSPPLAHAIMAHPIKIYTLKEVGPGAKSLKV